MNSVLKRKKAPVVKAKAKAKAKVEADVKPKVGHKRRGIGRPVSGPQTVGRESLVARTCELLREIPPSRLTRAEVARQLHVDPSLIRYYFKNRSALLLAAAERLTGEFTQILETESARAKNSPEGLLSARVTAMLQFEIRYPFFHRLLLEEIVTDGTPFAVRFMDTLTKRAVAGYQSIVTRGAEEGRFRSVDPVFLLLTVIGVCEFFVNGLPILQIAKGKAPDGLTAEQQYLDFIMKLLVDGLRVRGP